MKKFDPINIVLILRSGGDFKVSDVYLLAAHINKYWQGSLRPNIYCYTDLMQEELSVVGLTFRPLPHKAWRGWWSKLNLFSPELKNLRPFLYLDLDTAVIGSLSSFIPKEKAVTYFITLEDFYRKGKLASGVMWIPNTAYMDKIFAEWKKDPVAHIKRFRGDQNFIESVTKADAFWQQLFAPEAITTFKPNKVWRTELPENSSVVCFHGTPRIPQAAEKVEWVNDYKSYAI